MIALSVAKLKISAGKRNFSLHKDKGEKIKLFLESLDQCRRLETTLWKSNWHTTFLSRENMSPTNWPAFNCVSSQLSWLEHCTGIAEVMSLNPVESPEFFRFMRQVLKLSSKCKDHIFIWLSTLVLHFFALVLHILHSFLSQSEFSNFFLYI